MATTTSAERLRAYQGPALFSFGFRPFFLLGAMWAAFCVPAWILVYAFGPDALPFEAGMVWHMHEMLFGYGSAVVAGFLLTAVPNWTGRLPVCGLPLAGLAGLWVAGRVAMLVASEPSAIAAAIDVSFLIVFAAIIWREVIAGKNVRNLKVALAVSVLAIGNMAFHGVMLAGGGMPRLAIHLGLATLLMLILLIGGRITPSFTGNWLKKQGEATPPGFGVFDQVTLIGSLVALGLWLVGEVNLLTGIALMCAGLAHFARMSRWRGHRTFREPLVVILHVGYAWAALALVLLGLAALLPGTVPQVTGVHAAGAGAIGVMTLAVMTRASLGHTGGALVADAGTSLIFVLVNAGAVARVVAPFLDMPAQVAANGLASTLWAGAFVAFVVVYGPRLLAPRP